MEFRLLGPLEVRDQAEAIVLGPPRIRAVCGLLLARPGALVAIERFVDELWPTHPPANARALVRDYVSRLRSALRSGPSGAERVLTRKPGYLLRIEDQERDVDRFERLVADARTARQAGEPRRAADLFRRAGDLWRGEPFADVPPTATIVATATWLTEQRLAAQEEWFDAALAAGQVVEVLTELTEFVSAHPSRERPVGQLMVALYRSGRQSEALGLYQRIRTTLVDELGIDPSDELRRLHQRILNGDPALNPAADQPTGTGTPRQLPRDLATFVGRERELAHLGTLLAAGAAPVVVLHGAPGVGKSALATHAAHLSASRFPDGHLHVNLRGATPGVRPLSAAEALHQLLRGLGVAGTDLSADVDEAAGSLRTAVAGRRLLVVLDNAATAVQVRPLLAGCAVLVTSRTRLSALDGATHVHVGPLSAGEAHLMLDGLISDVRPAAEPEATRRLAELCGYLPLGLHLAAARLNARSTWAVRDLVDRLADERHRLTELAAGDIALRGSLAVSHTALHRGDDPTDRLAARALCLFGLLPVADLDLEVAAALLDTSPEEADRIVERLLDAHLVEETARRRFHLHDLTRLFANERAADTVSAQERSSALTRVMTCFLATMRLANTLVYPHRVHHGVPEVAAAPRPLAGRDEALRWLDEQCRNLVAVVRQAWQGPTELVRVGVDLAMTLHWYLLSGSGGAVDLIGFQEEVVTVAGRLGDRRALALAHGNLAVSHLHFGELDQADAHGRAELDISREIGDRFGEQRALGNLGFTSLAQRRPDQAIGHLQRQLELARAIDSPIGQAFALVNLGKAHHQLGRSDEAITMIGTGLALYEETGDFYRQCDACEVLARIHLDLGRYDQAVALVTRGLGLAMRTANRLGEIWALTILARAHRLSGDLASARHYADRAVTASGNLHGTQARTDALAEHALLARGRPGV